MLLEDAGISVSEGIGVSDITAGGEVIAGSEAIDVWISVELSDVLKDGEVIVDVANVVKEFGLDARVAGVP